MNWGFVVSKLLDSAVVASLHVLEVVALSAQELRDGLQWGLESYSQLGQGELLADRYTRKQRLTKDRHRLSSPVIARFEEI